MRLPFDQTNLRSPSQNRLSPVSSPRVQLLDLQTSANYAKLESLKQLGKGIFSIGDAIFENYARETQKEKERNIQLLGLDLNRDSIDLQQSFETTPSASALEDEQRIHEWYYGAPEGEKSRFQKLQDKYGISEKDMEVYFKRFEVNNLSKVMGLRARRDQDVERLNAKKYFNTTLLNEAESFDINSYPKEKGSFIDQRREELVGYLNDATKGLKGGLKTDVEAWGLDIINRELQQGIRLFDVRTQDANAAAFEEGYNEIMSLDLAREERLNRYASLINEYGDQGKGLFDEKATVEKMAQAEEEVDLAFAERLIATDPQQFIDLWEQQEPGKESMLPGLSVKIRGRLYDKALDAVNSINSERASAAQEVIDRTLTQMMRPDAQKSRLEADFNRNIELLPETKNGKVYRAKYQSAFDYVKSLAYDFVDPLKSNRITILTALAKPAPQYYLDENGEGDPAIELKEAAHRQFIEYHKQIRDSRAKDPASFYAAKFQKQDALEYFEEASLDGSVREQTRYLTGEGHVPITLAREVRQGRISLLPNEVKAAMLNELENTQEGVPYSLALQKYLTPAGKYGPLLMEELSRDKKNGGIGLELSAYHYTMPHSNAILQRIRTSELVRPELNKNKKTILGAKQETDFNQQIQSNEVFDGFRQSMAIGDTSSTQMINSTFEMVKGYALLLMSEGESFSNAIEMANDHILGKQFAFLEPGFDEGYKVRIPRIEMEDLEEGQFQDALTLAAERALEGITSDAIRSTAEDRNFRWTNHPMDTGLLLYSQDPETLLFVPVESDGGEITWSDLRALASIVDQVPEQPSGVGSFVEDVVGDVGETIKEAGSSAMESVQETVDSITESVEGGIREIAIDPKAEAKESIVRPQPKGLIPELIEEIDQVLSAPVQEMEQKAIETGDISADRDAIDRYVGTAKAIIANAKDRTKARKAVDRLLKKAAQNLANIRSRQALDKEIQQLFDEEQ